MLCTSGFADDVISSHNGSHGASCVGPLLSGDRIVYNSQNTASIPTKYILLNDKDQVPRNHRKRGPSLLSKTALFIFEGNGFNLFHWRHVALVTVLWRPALSSSSSVSVTALR